MAPLEPEKVKSNSDEATHYSQDILGDDGEDGSSEDESGSFQPATNLPNSRVIKRNLEDLMLLVEGPYLDLNPEYQRDVVWQPERMTGLINSLMENFYIPPVIFNIHEIEVEDGIRWQRVCVDGKQRISSVQAFMQGRIPCHDRYGNKWYYCGKTGKSGNPIKGRRVLPEHMKKIFRQKEFVCYEFKNLSSKQEEDLFGKVQMGVSLTPAEKMRATSGPWQDFTRLFEDDFSSVVGLAKTDRGAGFRLLLCCFSQILEVQHPTNANGKPTLRTNSKHLQDVFMKNIKALDDATKSHLASVFTTFKELVEEDLQTFKNNGYRTVKTFAPVELIAVAVLISMYGDSRNNALLLGDVRAMRLTLRQTRHDLQMNQGTWDTIWGFLESLESYRGAVDGFCETVRKTTTNAQGELKSSEKTKPSHNTTTSEVPAITNPTARSKLSRPRLGTRPSPSLFLHSSSPDSVLPYGDDQDHDMVGDVAKPLPLSKTTLAPSVPTAPIAPMVPIGPNPNIAGSKQKSASLITSPFENITISEQSTGSSTHGSAPDSAVTELHSAKSAIATLPHLTENQERERQDLLAQFRASRDPSSSEDLDDLPIRPLKRRAEIEFGRAGGGVRAPAMKRRG